MNFPIFNWHWFQNEQLFKRFTRSRGYCSNNDRPSSLDGGVNMKGYNTGKIIIGCRYEPPRRSHMDDLNIWWQVMLLARKKTFWARFKQFLTGVNK
jgi:hypothetical protein